MNKTSLIAVAKLLLANVYVVAMPTWKNEEDFKQWVTSQKEIQVKTINNNTINVSIHDQSTVQDIKMSLQETEGIEVERQFLFPTFMRLGRIHNGPRLENYESIKRVMNYWDTDRFLLVTKAENQPKYPE